MTGGGDGPGRPSGSAAVAASASGAEVCPARHCWVAGAVDDRGVRRPGLLVEWRSARGAWEGRVVYAARLRPDAWVLVEEWVPATLLTPR